ncbi:methyltransferase domain-containing protein [Niveispirillum sp. SYP-B3756]|uniref:methyltransferase domain-containing protein n=1 Tax=Niveispirillum sp. SYP-B3756 TaxID=2662178 RepID=UPI001291DA9B|nr:methyltransferase domain-containing protein [Niveispirillum sp. SYP-B3756]MQP64432.1 methyltransferase domain-containing protein [Niveispirillum sp. SYP-B3756]
MAWNPAQYELFRAARERPGLDLLAAIPPLEPDQIVDLGCGTGYLTRLLGQNYPRARVTGVDNDRVMLAKAAAEPSGITWELGDAAQWRPGRPVDLIFSNAALHWLPDHHALFPQLARALAADGVLAIQMPRNFNAPSHRILQELASDGPWAEALKGALHHETVQAADAYYRLLRPHCRQIDIWETEYLHVLPGTDPVLEWVKGTTLLPVMARLDEDMAATFRDLYAERLRAAYPTERDGNSLFPFRRLFIVAGK